MSKKAFDLILIGATGFTGKRAARYLNDNCPEEFKWGIAGRNINKLNNVAQQLNIQENRLFVVDTTVQAQVEEVVQKARIIISTAGPFSLYGEEVIAACAKFGTHYLDITGEVGFIKNMQDKYGDLAKETGAVLIPFSGFDSIPADIATFLLSKQFSQPKHLSIKSYYSISGGFNGGTIATMLNKFETGEFKKMNDPKLLIQKPGFETHTPEHRNFFGFDGNIRRWSAPFIMGAINSKIVYKSASDGYHAGTPYSESLAYSEHSSLGKWYNPLPFLMVSLIVISIKLLGPQKWFRALLKKIMPSPGEGPSEAQIENGYFKLLGVARDEENNSATVTISYPGDPGNKSTVFFLCESAMCLSENKESFNDKSGFLTPVTAFGDLLIGRLQEKGLHITTAKE